VEDIESFVEGLIDVQDGGYITASIAVVWSGPDCHEVLVLEPVLETIHDKLMCSGNQRNIVNVIEFCGDLGTKEPSSSSWRHSPSFDVFWIRPHKVTEWTFMRNFHSSVNKSNLIDGLDLWGKSSMDAEDFAFNNSSNTKIVEHFSAILPWVCISVLSNGLIVETIYGCDLSGLVVTSQESDVSWVLQLKAEQKLESLY
jgi:hypothetical protein